MADYFPLIVDAANSTIDELPAGDNLNLANSGIVNAGNITASFFIGDGSQLTNVPIGTSLSNGNSSVNIPAANGNVNVNVSGNANILVITGTGVNVAGTLNTGTSNANVGNLGTAQVLATANVTAPQLISNIANGTAPLVVTSTTQVANLSVATAGAATTAGTVTTAAQPNITSVGTLTDLNVSGNAIVGGNLTVNGNLVYVNVETLAIEDPIIQLQSGPNGAAPAANSGKDVGTGLNYYDTQARVAFMGWDVSNAEFGMASQASITSEVVTFTAYGNLRVGNIIGNGQALTGLAGGNVTGQVGNALVAGTVYTAAQPNITSVGTLSSLSVTGNLSSGNANLGNLATANFFQGDGSLLTNIPIGTSLSNGNSNVSIPSANGNVNISAAGNANILVVTGTGANVAGTLNVTGNVRTGAVVGVNTTANAWANANAVQVGSASFWNYLGDTNMSVSQNYFFDGTNYKYVQAGAAAGYEVQGGAHEWKNAPVGVANANVTLTTRMALDANGNLTTSGRVAATGNVSGANLTTAGVLEVTGNANVGNIGATNGVFTNVSGNGSALSSITGANVTGTVAAATTAGTVTTNAQPNITSVGTLSSLTATGNVAGGNLTTGGALSVTGNANVGNLGTTQVLATANITAPQLISNVAAGTAPLVVTSNTVVTNLNADLLDGFNSASANTANTIALRDASGNLAANFFIGNGSQLTGLSTASISNGNSNVNIPAANGNVNISAVGNANVLVVTGTGANIAGTLNATGNVTVGNLITGAGTGGNISGANVITANTFVGALTGNATGSAATVTTAAQPNITSVGTLTSLGVTGNISSGNANLGNAATANFFIGSGNNLSNIQGANVTGTVSAATTAGTVTTAAQPNITSVGTLTALTVTGNVSAGNVSATTFTGALTGNATGSAATVTTAAQPNITSVGTLSSLTASGNVTGGNLVTAGKVYSSEFINGGTGIYLSAGPAGYINFFTTGGDKATITDTGNIAASNLIANSTVFATTANISGNVNAGNVSGTLLTGTLTTNAQPNITSVGTLTALSVTGNVAGGNLTTVGVLSVTGTGVSSIAGNLDMTSNTIINLATPTNSTDAATKQYVDDVAQGLNVHPSCNAATTTTLASISGGTITYNNGTAGVGATLTTTGTYTTIDGVTLSDGMRILVKNEVTTANNGIYVRTSATVLTRATDFDSAVEIAGGDFTFVTAGTQYNSTGWVQIDEVTTVGTDPIVWEQFSGAGTYQAGTGLTLTGSTFSVNASQTQVTSVGTLTGLNSSGTITAPAFTANTGVFTGNGSALTALNASNVSSGTLDQARLANASVTLGSTALTLGSTVTTVAGLTSVTSTTFVGALTGAATTAGTVTTAAQGNITSVGTLTGLGVNGTITGVNITANTGVFTGNGSGLSAIAGANVTGAVSFATTANAVAGANVSGTVANATFATSAGSATTAGTVTTAAQPNITSVGTLTSLGVNGTVTAVAFTANTGVFTGNANGLSSLQAGNLTGTVAQARLANSSVTLGSTALTLGSTVTTVAGLTSVTSTSFVGALTGAATSATTAGTVTTAAQPNITSVGTLTSLAVTGNVTAGNLIAGGGAGGNITGANLVSANFFTGTITTAAQPNITSVGTLTSLTTTTLTTGANSTAGTVTGNWTLTAGSRWQSTYADLAERYVADEAYEPGTVVVLGGEQEVTIENIADSHKVAGVVTTNPAYIMNVKLQGDNVIEVALIGRVPCKVVGPINKGDLLTSAAIAGYAHANNNAGAGKIIGKSLENFDGEMGVIEIMVGKT